ncbi:MAG TPA: hypothetical protein ENL04_04835 [Sulfuricurvum sp.]|nr:hypothetical protein [Sulfuricurvum sp.]
MTKLRSIISPFLIAHIALYGLLAVSKAAMLNAQVAFVSAFLILLGSMYSYRRLVMQNLQNDTVMHQDDLVDKIDDPYDLYSETEEREDDRPLKEVIKEEKARLKANKATAKNVSKSTPALLSVYRLVPYAVLVLGFIALKNNGMLELGYFLPGLAAGIAAGYFSGKALFTPTR